MYRSHDTVEDQLHALLLPEIRKIELFASVESHKTRLGVEGKEDTDSKDEDLEELMSDGHLPLLKSLLSLFHSSTMVFEQFAKNKKYSSMAMVLTLSTVVGQCLKEETLQKLLARYTMLWENRIKSKQSKVTRNNMRKQDLRLYIPKSLMCLCSHFPFEFVDNTAVYIKEKEEEQTEEHHRDRESDEESVATTMTTASKFAERARKREIAEFNVFQLNMKTMNLCSLFREYWKHNLNLDESHKRGMDNERVRSQRNYSLLSYNWITNTIAGMEDKENINVKAFVQLLQMLKKTITLYDNKRQIALLRSLDKMLKHPTLASDAQDVFAQFLK